MVKSSKSESEEEEESLESRLGRLESSVEELWPEIWEMSSRGMLERVGLMRGSGGVKTKVRRLSTTANK